MFSTGLSVLCMRAGQPATLFSEWLVDSITLCPNKNVHLLFYEKLSQKSSELNYFSYRECRRNSTQVICSMFTTAEKCYTLHTYTHTFNGPFSRTTQVSRYQKGKTNLDFTEARDSEWQWHQLEHMQVCTSLQTDKKTKTKMLYFVKGKSYASDQISIFFSKIAFSSPSVL